jgi:hypothetical protein
LESQPSSRTGENTVRNDREGRGNVGIIRSPVRASTHPTPISRHRPCEAHRVCTTARRGWFSDLGHYYILDFKHNWIVKRHVDPEELARDLGVLKDYEQLLGSWSYLNT